jgi:hypothetical protein
MFSNRVLVYRDGDLYKVRVQGISSKTESERYRRMMLDENINGFIVPAQAR